MFSTISLNYETPHADCSRKFKSNYEFGKKEWQQNYITTTQDHYPEKQVKLFKSKLKDNKIDLSSKKYLKPNFSHIDNGKAINNQYLTSNKRDYKELNLTNNKNDNNFKEFIKASKIVVNFIIKAW